MSAVRRFALVVIILLLIARIASAWTPPFEDTRGRLLVSDGMVATIDQNDGEETLTVPVTLRAVAGAGWIFAVPSSAGSVRVAFTPGMKFCRGTWPNQLAGYDFTNALVAAQYLEIYPLFYEAFRPSLSRTATLGASNSAVVVKDGLRCELAAAASADELRAAINRAGMSLDSAVFEEFAPLVDGHHSFVLLCNAAERVLSDPLESEYQLRNISDVQDSVVIMFPANHPILPPVVRGHSLTEIEFNLTVIGHVTLADPSPVTLQVHAAHFTGSTIPVINGKQSPPYRPTRYTRIEGSATTPVSPQMDFIPSSGPRLAIANVLVSLGPLPFVLAFAVFVSVLNYMAGGICGLVVLRQWRLGSRLGLWNFMTVFGVWIRSAQRIPSRVRADIFSICFSLCFTALCIACSELASFLFAMDPHR